MTRSPRPASASDVHQEFPARRASRLSPAVRVRLRFLVAGLGIGWIWIRQSGEPLWEHAVRPAILVLIVVPVISALRRRVRRARNLPPPRHLRISRLLAAKLALIAGALGATVLVGMWTSHADTYVALGLVVVVAVVGPILLPHFVGAKYDPPEAPGGADSSR